MNLSKDIIGIVYKYLLPLKNHAIKDECLKNLIKRTVWIYGDLNIKKKYKFYRRTQNEKIWYLSYW